jgi:hypothetical protein
VGILDWPLNDSRQPKFGKKIRRDFSLRIGMRDRKVGVWALMDYEIPSDEAMQGQRYTLTKRCS